MAKLKARCKECGKEGEVVTVLAKSEKEDVTDDFLCCPCWRKKKKRDGVEPPRGVSVGWLEE